MPTYFALSFPPKVRYTGMAIGYTLGTVLSAAVAPIVGTSLLAATGGWVDIATYMTVMAAISFVAAIFLRELSPNDLDDRTLSNAGQLRQSQVPE